MKRETKFKIKLATQKDTVHPSHPFGQWNTAVRISQITEKYSILQLIHWAVESRSRNWQGETVMMVKPEQALEMMLTWCEQLPPNPTAPNHVLHLYNKGNNGTDDIPRNCYFKNTFIFMQEANILWRLLMHVISIHTTYHKGRRKSLFFIKITTYKVKNHKDWQQIQKNILILWLKANLCSLESARLLWGLEYFFFLLSRSSSTDSWKFCLTHNYQTRTIITFF